MDEPRLHPGGSSSPRAFCCLHSWGEERARGPQRPLSLLGPSHSSVLLESSQAAGSARGRLLQSTLRLRYRLFRGVTTFNTASIPQEPRVWIPSLGSAGPWGGQAARMGWVWGLGFGVWSPPARAAPKDGVTQRESSVERGLPKQKINGKDGAAPYLQHCAHGDAGVQS